MSPMFFRMILPALGVFALCLPASAAPRPARAASEPAPMCGTEDAAAAWLSEAVGAQLRDRKAGVASPPVGVRDLPSAWGIERHGDLVIMRDHVGSSFNRDQLDPYAIYDAIFRFYDVYPDDYDFLTILTVEDSSSGGGFAFYSPLANDADGIGERRFSSGYDLDGILFMNSWQYWVGANDTFTSAVFGQELGHRWGAYVGYDLGDGVVHNDTLGRDDSHWSYWLETSNSPMEGNTWIDEGDGTFTLDAGEEIAYSNLDLYLMGLIGPEDVAPFFLITEPEGLNRDAASSPEYYYTGRDQQTEGVRVDITIDDIIRAEGERSPAVGSSQTNFKMVVLLLLSPEQQQDDNNVEGGESARVAFEKVWEEDTLGLADLDLSIGDVDNAPLDMSTFSAPFTVPTAAW